MTYTLINAFFLGFAALVTALWLRGRWWSVVAKALVVMLTMTAIFDNVIIGLGIVKYHESAILGLRVGLAPIEDFGYTVATVFLITTLWSKLSQGDKWKR